jgi:hypothetical protein
VRRRFAGLVKTLAGMRDVDTGTYAHTPPPVSAGLRTVEPLPASAMRTGMRMAEQFVSNALYGAI